MYLGQLMDHLHETGGGWGYSDKGLVCFVLYKLPYLDKLFELCPFIETVPPHENHVDGLFLTTSCKSPEINNFDIIFVQPEQPQ